MGFFSAFRSRAAAPISPEVDRAVLRITLAVWIGQFVLIVVRSWITQYYDDPGSLAARGLTALTGAAVTWAVHLLLRSRTMSGPRRFGWAILLCVPACLFVVFWDEVYFLLLSPKFRAEHGAVGQSEIAFNIAFFVWIFIAWASIYASAFHTVEIRERDRRIASAESAIQKARLAALRLQINPHFLFNTLNSLSGLIALDRKKDAAEMVANLADYMRHTLEAAPVDMVPLRKEVESETAYLRIEAMRFSDRLKVKIALEPEAARVNVPTLIIQPLVENAIKHGVEPTSRKVAMTIGARVDQGMLSVWVENSVVEPGPRPQSLGIGLANVSDRLRILFGDKARLDYGPTPSGGWRSEIVMPVEGAGMIAEA